MRKSIFCPAGKLIILKQEIFYPKIRSGAGDGNRTRVTSLEGSGSTIEPRPH